MNWKPLLFRLPFRFGVVHIGVAKFQAIQPEGHPFKLPPHPDFDQLPVDSFGKGKGTEAIILTSHPIQKPLKRISMVHGMLCYVPETYRRYCVSLSGSFQEYLEKFPAKKRYTVQSKVRKLMKDGGEFQVYRSAEELLRFYPLAREVSRKTWHEALLKGGLAATPEFQEILRARGDQDAARGFLLFKNGSPIAFIYSSVDDGVPILDRLGYDPEFRNASPGTVLQ